MKLTKFERRKQEILKKHEEELQALMEAERKEREKMIEPIIEKLTKVANEEARKILEKNPEILETYSFRKREAAKAVSEAFDALFSETDEKEESRVSETEEVQENRNETMQFGDEAAAGQSNETPRFGEI